MDTPPLHESLEPVAFLVGEWQGGGQGTFPTIEPFEWREETRFWHVGRPVLLYAQRTHDAATGEPRHVEFGFVRPGSADGSFELVVSHSTGHAEVCEGTAVGTRLELRSTSMVGTPTAKTVTAVDRVYELDGEVLRVRLAMEAVGEPMTDHLEGALTRATA
ncbi:MAG: FABP family protein [Actinomycetota bacterium]